MYDVRFVTRLCFPLWNTFFQTFTSGLCVYLDLKWVSGRQHIMGLIFVSIQPLYVFRLEHLVHLHLIIDRYVLIAILLTVKGISMSLFFIPLWVDDYIQCYIWILYYVCLSIIDFCSVVSMRFIAISLYIYMIILKCWFFNFKCILSTLHLYSLRSKLLFWHILYLFRVSFKSLLQI